ncbi:MAG: PHP domain-containing protein [Rhodothermales bacterium]|nr:PHP domain-containing protein [Rhodothermales bacterium]
MFDVRRADLHTHTTCSDGRLAPAALVAHARACGLHALAVTDHDCIDALPEAFAAGRRHHIEVVAGVELSVTVEGEEVHLLGYFFDPEHAGLRAHLEAFQEARRARAAEMVERLRGLGVGIALGDVLARAGGRSVGRPHVAEALAAAGYVAEPRDAFDRYIGDGGPAFAAKPRFEAAEALALVHDAGGIGVLAHPGHWTRDATLMALIRAGLDGIETIHPSHDASLTRYYRTLARDFGLLETGGSDYHGPRDDGADRLGRYSIPYPRFERVRRAASRAPVT